MRKKKVNVFDSEGESGRKEEKCGKRENQEKGEGWETVFMRARMPSKYFLETASEVDPKKRRVEGSESSTVN